MRRARWALGVADSGVLAAAVLTLAWTVAVRWAPFPAGPLEPRRAASLTVLDRAGGVLRQQATAAGGRESWVPLARLSPHLVAATIAAEDHRFFAHAGVDPLGVLRAAWLNLRARRVAYGGSTLTMQLVRLLEPARPRRGLGAKLREAVLAARLERRLDKQALLAEYLNRAYYGNGAYGAEAAAQLYLGKPAAQLSAGEAAFLAVLPRGPSLYNPYLHLPRALARRDHILARMEALGALGPAEADLARGTPLPLRRERPGFHAPHFVDQVISTLPAGARAGATVETTLDLPLQARLEVALREHLGTVGGYQVTQAGLVVLRNSDGAILALVGSRDYFEAARSGAANVLTLRRRPGSTLKPFIYGLALEGGDSPATIALDVILPGEARETYTADVRQHGPARYREALAGSYNLAAVHTLEQVGVGALLSRLRAAGLDTLDAPDARYTPSLAIGDAEVRVLDLTAAFAAFGNGGQPLRPLAVQSVVVAGGGALALPRPAPLPRAFSPAVAYLIFDMLADPDARRPMFGSQAPMALPFPVALKTGTTRAYTDNLAFGTTREFTVGAWAGNFDGAPMQGLMAMYGAAPLVRAAFVALAARFGTPTAPDRPAGIVEADVCPHSGRAPGPACPTRKRELFLAGSAPAPDAPCPWHRVRCGRLETRWPDEAQGWARARGLLRPPPCPEEAAPGELRILYPADGARFSLDPHRPPEHQVPPLRSSPAGAPVRWTVDGQPAARFRPTPGEHVVRAERGGAGAEVRIWFD
jgi:penicillin-binding protein 1C